MRRIIVCLAILGLATTLAYAQGPSKQQELQAKGIDNWSPGMFRGQGPTFGRVGTRFADGPASLSTLGTTGTLQYDSGAINALPTLFGVVYGNQFNVTNGGGTLGGSLLASSFHFYFMEDSTPDTGLFFQPATFMSAGMINALTSFNITGLANSGPSFSAPALNTVAWGALGVTSNFTGTNGVFLGGWCLNANTAFPVDNETLGLDTVAGGAGLKGYTASSGTGPQPFTPGSFNAVLRVTGTAANIPVELISFEAD